MLVYVSMRYHLIPMNMGAKLKLNRTQIFADPPAMRGTSGQVYTDNIIVS